MVDDSLDILLLGATGQIGAALLPELQALGRVDAVGRQRCDLADSKAIEALLAGRKPHIIINAAAYTAVDRAETEPELAQRLNAELPRQLAAFAFQHNALLVDFSTDYVFDGAAPRPWRETDQPAPLNVYGRTKLEGLREIEGSGCRYLVFRVTWIYARRGNNFPNTMLRLAAEREALSVVSDQIGAPTPASWIAETVVRCLPQVLVDEGKCGLYNLAPAGSVSWYDFACEIIAGALARGRQLKVTPDTVAPLSSADYPTAARRPANSLLDTGKLQRAFAILPPHWRSLLDREGILDP
ncbi:MAG: dTDP-4-dehydrorhamnose reductase [Porticoccaceae bacterium]